MESISIASYSIYRMLWYYMKHDSFTNIYTSSVWPFFLSIPSILAVCAVKCRAQVAQTALVMCILVGLYARYRHGKNMKNQAEKKDREKMDDERALLSKAAFHKIVTVGDVYLEGLKAAEQRV